MLAAVSERRMLSVRGMLLLLWCLLIGSLFWDPVSPRLTDPANLASPLRAGTTPVLIQGQAVLPEPHPLGMRVFWTLVVPLAPLFIMVVGHEAWRRICPLSFLTQLPRLLGRQRRRRTLNRQSGAVEARLVLPAREGWWRRHALHVQFGLLFLGLNTRILAINGDPLALGGFFLLVLTAALGVGWLWGGKTWCNYLCPMGVVQRVYSAPGGLLESRPHLSKPPTPASMCRTPGQGGDRSACVGCTPSCPDTDLERAHWEGLDNPALRHVYFGLFGLVIGFYSNSWLYAGNWDYYFSGIWAQPAGNIHGLLDPGLYLAGQALPIPRLLSTPLVLGLGVAGGIALWSALERLYGAACRRWAPAREARVRRHQVLVVCAFLTINTYYFFGGRPNLVLMAPQVQAAVDILIVLLTTLWLVQAWRRTPTLYRHESLAAGLRRQLAGMEVDFPGLLDGRRLEDLQPSEVYVLARTLPGFGRERRLQAYRALVEDLARTHKAETATSHELLSELRRTLDIDEAGHRQVLLELGLERVETDEAGHSAVLENYLRRDNFRLALEATVLGRLSPGMTLTQVLADPACAATVNGLREVYQMSPEDHARVLAGIASTAGELYERALHDIDALGQFASLDYGLRLGTLGKPALQAAARLLMRERLAGLRPQVERVLGAVVALGESPAALALARQLGALLGERLAPLLEQPVPGQAETPWSSLLGPAQSEALGGMAPSGAGVGPGMVPYRALIARGPSLRHQLEALAREGSAPSPLAGWLLESLFPESARHLEPAPPGLPLALTLARCRLFEGLSLEALMRLQSLCEPRLWAAGQWVFRAGDPADDLLVMRSGEGVLHPGELPLEPLAELPVFGGAGLLGAARHASGLQVLSPEARFLALPCAKLSALMLRQPAIAAAIFAALAETAGPEAGAAARERGLPGLAGTAGREAGAVAPREAGLPRMSGTAGREAGAAAPPEAALPAMSGDAP